MAMISEFLLQQPGYLLLLLGLALAAAFDCQQFRIPNPLVLLLLLVGATWQVQQAGWTGALSTLGGAGVCLLVFIPLYALSAMGAGDVKLMAAAGSFMAAPQALLAALASLAIGSCIGLGVLLIKGGLPDYLRRYVQMARTCVTTGQLVYIPPAGHEVAGQKFPFAIAIFLGSALAVLITPLQKLAWYYL